MPTAGRVELLTPAAGGEWDLTSTILPRDGSALGGFALGVEAELSVLAPNGGVAQPGQTQAMAVGAQLAGSHVSVVSWDVFGSGAPTHFSALSWDRHPA